MTFRASQPVDFFFLCRNGCNTVLYLLARPLDSYHHLDRPDAHQLAVHLLHLGEDFLVFHSLLGRFRLTKLDRITQNCVELQHCQSGSVGLGGVTHGLGDGEVADIDVVLERTVVDALVGVLFRPATVHLRDYLLALLEIFLAVALRYVHLVGSLKTGAKVRLFHDMAKTFFQTVRRVQRQKGA